MVKPSLRLLLVAGFCILLLGAWSLPPYHIGLGATKSVKNIVNLLAAETSRNVQQKVDRQYKAVAQIQYSLRNLSQIRGLPWTTNATARSFRRSSSGYVFAMTSFADLTVLVRFSDGSFIYAVKDNHSPDDTSLMIYQFCDSDGIYNYSRSPTTQHIEMPRRCTIEVRHRDSPQVTKPN